MLPKMEWLFFMRLPWARREEEKGSALNGLLLILF